MLERVVQIKICVGHVPIANLIQAAKFMHYDVHPI